MSTSRGSSALSKAFRNEYDRLLHLGTREPVQLYAAARSKNFSLEGTPLSEGNGIIVPQFAIQRFLRPLFGKGVPQMPEIGNHPDFAHLKGTDNIEYSPITTLFMDIENSSRLNLLFKLEDVRHIKRAILCAAIEIVKSFNGHVHRLQGDAVIAYFGGKTMESEMGVLDSLNCASMLICFVQNTVIPQLQDQVGDHDFGIRIGIDHGKKEDVLWSSYGYPGVDEVTATSLYVDLTSKLQHSAPRNQIMIGQSLKEFIDIPEGLVTVKRVKRDREESPEPFIQPNLTDANGNPLNYRKFIFNWREYLKCSPVASYTNDLYSSENSALECVTIQATVHDHPVSGYGEPCIPAGTSIPKGKWIKFRLSPPEGLIFPCDIEFKVENHGKEAENRGPACDNHNREYYVHDQLKFSTIEHWEHTAYRGLHYMTVEIKNGDVTKYRSRFGVYIR